MMLIILQLRCSGQRSGCDRCEAVGYPCIYSPAAHSRDARKVNKRSTSAWRKAVKRRGFIQHAEEVGSHQDLSSRNHFGGYEHGLGHSLNQKNNQENDPQGQQKLQQQSTPNASMANTTNESCIENLPHISTGFGSGFETLYGPKVSPAVDTPDYSIGVDGPWASFAATLGDTYFMNPMGMTYDAFEYGSMACNHVFTSLLPSSSSGEYSQAQKPVALASTTSDISAIL